MQEPNRRPIWEKDQQKVGILSIFLKKLKNIHIAVTINFFKVCIQCKKRKVKQKTKLLSSLPKPFSHSTTKGQRRESQLPLPWEHKFVRFYCITVAEINTWMCQREDWVSKDPTGFQPHYLQHSPFMDPIASSSWEHCWTQPGQSRRQGTCYREGHCLQLAYCSCEDEQNHRKAKTVLYVLAINLLSSIITQTSVLLCFSLSLSFLTPDLRKLSSRQVTWEFS